jgi:hypothetical protein
VQAKTGFRTQSELPVLYGKCGDALHRGSLKKLLSPKTPLQRNFPDIIEWGQKINRLLNLHLISLIDGNTHVIAMLRNSEDNNNVQVSIAEPNPNQSEDALP